MPRKILIVEDDVKNRKLFRDVLSANGYETVEAMDGKTGVELARSHKPDLIIMDVQMPGMDGIEAVGILKKDPGTAEIPTIALTAFAMDGDKDRLLEAGFDGYLSKPINVKGFLHAVENYLNLAGDIALAESGEVEVV